MQPIVEVTGLCKRFGDFQAVHNLSFTVHEGDVYGFLGQNGAGKSTTLRMLLTLIAPSNGAIKIFGEELHRHRSSILQRIGAVIEKPDVYKYLSALDNLRLFARLSKLKPTHKALMDQLEMVGLAQRAKDKVGTFSQGMKQRMGLAIALMHNPPLVILDEPTNGLDPQGIADMRNLILHLSRERQKTVIVSSHLLSEIEQVATRVLIIDKGEKRVEDDARNLFKPEDTLVLLDTLDNTAATEILARSAYAQKLQTRSQQRIQLKMHPQDVPALNQFLVGQGVAVMQLQQQHSLEDYFLQITSAAQHVEPYHA